MVKHLGTICAVAFVQLGWTSLATASFMNLPLHDLFLRDDSSCATNYTSCGSSYPSNFCCSSDTTCLGLDNDSTVLCCPTGANCTYIEPITCDVQSLNATANPTASIKSTLLSDDLPTCADGCCPFGYTCAANTTCVLDVSTSSEANSSSSASSSTATATTMVSSISGLTVPSATPSAISISDSSPTSTSSGSSVTDSSMTANSTQTKTTTTCEEFPLKAILAGFFPGAVAGALAAAMIMMCRRRSDKQDREDLALKAHRSSGGAIIGISDPIPDDENGSFRTDFLLQRKLSGRFPAPGSVSRPKSRILRKTGTRVKSIFIGPNNHSKKNANDDSPQWNSASPPPVPAIPAAGELPVTPPQQTGGRTGPRQPSTESIKVYSPPNMLGINNNTGGRRSEDRNTTFSEVMEKAGFHNSKGEPSYKVVETPALSGNSPSRKK